jgi:uncharacterized membrane protein HdeD (DUF308 family)
MPRNPVTAAKDPGYHFMRNRTLEISLGFLAVIVGCLLLIDAFDSRGKKMIWPLSGLAPW